MPFLLFKGRVLPEVRNITAPCPVAMHYAEPNGGFACEFSISINDSRVEVGCTVEAILQDTIQNAMARALGFASGVTNIISFTTGWALQVVLDTVTIGNKETHVALSETRVAPLCTAFSLKDGFEEVCELVLTNLTLRFAFHDLVAGIGTENYSLVACGRAVEAVRHLVAGPDVKPSKGWLAMREALQLDESYLRGITDASANPRHGARGDATGAMQLEMTLRAWTIMNRYLEYRKRGGAAPLPIGEFPML